MPYTQSITSLSNETMTVTRRAENAHVKGKEQPSTDTSFSIKGSFQPAKGKDLQRLPEGRILSEIFALWTLTELRAGTPAGALADRVNYRGKLYEVEHVEPWLGWFGGNYWKVLVRAMP